MDTGGWVEKHMEGITGWRGLARPSRRIYNYNATPCAGLGLWVLTASRGEGRGREGET